MKTGWLEYNGKWYYLQAGGAMKTGWLRYNGKWYWFDSSGAMAADTTITIDGKRYTLRNISSGITSDRGVFLIAAVLLQGVAERDRAEHGPGPVDDG